MRFRLRDLPAERKLQLFLFALGALSFGPFFGVYQTASINDEGVVCLGAVRLCGGEALYTDFNTHFAPGTYYLTALFYLLLGPGVATTRLVAACITGGLALCVYLLSRRCLPERWALAPYLLMVSAGVTQWPILSYHWLGVLTFLIGTLALTRWQENPNPRSATLCGASMALSAWTLQSEAAALLLLTGLVALLCRKLMTLRLFGFWWAGCLGASLLLWAPILARTTISEIWLQNVVWALGHNAAQGRGPYDIGNITGRWDPFLSQLGQASWSPAVLNWALNSLSYLLVWSCNYLLFYPVLLGAALLALKWEKSTAFRILVLAQMVSTLAWSSRQTLLYLNFLTPVFFILLVVLLRRLGKTGLVMTLATTAVYGTGYVYQWREAAGYRFPILTPRGMLYSASPEEARLLTRIFAEAYRLTPPGSPAFCYPYAMGFCYLSGVKPVGKMFAVIPILGEDSEVPEQIADLARFRVPYIYQFPWSPETLNAVPYVEEEKFWSLVKKYDGEILQDYEPALRFPIATVYKRKAAP